MNISTPVLSTSFTKLLNKNIDRTACMLYNNYVGDSVTFGQHSGPRSNRFSEERITRKTKLNVNQYNNPKNVVFEKLVTLCKESVKPDNISFDCIEKIDKMLKDIPLKILIDENNTNTEKSFFNEVMAYYLEWPTNFSLDQYKKDMRQILEILDND